MSYLQPLILMVAGAVLGITIYVQVIPSEAMSSCQRQSGALLAELTPQASEYYYTSQQPTDIVLKSSKPLFSELPGDHVKTYFMPCGKRCHPTQRALRQLGWDKVNEKEHARMVYVDFPTIELSSGLQSWQRFNHIPNYTVFSNKDEFLTVMADYQKAHGPLDFLPQTYRLYKEEEYTALQRVLRTKKRKNHPWIVKRGVNHFSVGHSFIPSSTEVKTIVKEQFQDRNGSVQEYVCHQMTWKRQEFVVRVYWFIASLDPLLVLYQDGYVRVGYCRGDMEWLQNDDQLISFDEFESYLLEKKGKRWKNKHVTDHNIDPLMHVRNQIKAALATITTAVTFTPPPLASSDMYGASEDAFGVFAADFIIDQDLDVWLGEVYHHKQPGLTAAQEYLTEDYYFLFEKGHQLWYGMGSTLEEVWSKQQRHVNLLPLIQTGQWHLIVAGDKWKFEYPTHKRDNRKKKSSCKLLDDLKLVRKRAAERELPLPTPDEGDEDVESNDASPKDRQSRREETRNA